MIAKPRRGVALIIVLSVLSLLVLLGVSYLTLQQLERQQTVAYSDQVLARLVARTGMEQGYAMLQNLVQRELEGAPGDPGSVPPLRALRYYGNDVDERGDNPALLNVPLEVALNPSLALESVGPSIETPQNPVDGNIRPARLKIDGKVHGVSGYTTGSRYGYRTDVFSLRITDLSGLLHVNDGVGENPEHGSVSRNLRRILNRLGDVLGAQKMGDRIVDSRPRQGYGSKVDLEKVLGPKDYERAAPFLTIYAWVDKNVIQPVPLSDAREVMDHYKESLGYSSAGSASPYYRGKPAVFRYGRGRDRDGNLMTSPLKFAPDAAEPAGEDHAIWGVDELNPQWIEVCARAPVNLNTAPREVLVALLSDLQGFWVAERRRNHPNITSASQNTRVWSNQAIQTLDPSTGMSGGDGDAFGYLYTTDKITWSPTTTQLANSAGVIADELIACREGRVSRSTQFDYDRSRNPKAWFAGTFRTWRQFYAFCDHLVPLGLVKETRQVFHHYPAPGTGLAGGGEIAPAGIADPLAAIATQAIADVIKANFNPNCHLNETNPDENMALLVDKTDLIVMSTEGCFLPGGYFEIASLGRVLRPLQISSGSGTTTASQMLESVDAFAARDNKLMAQASINGVVKLYDSRRFTSQKDFYAGEITRRRTLPETNNGLSLETGPEPDSGVAPAENEWGGYLALATNGGGPWSAAPGGPETPLPKDPMKVGFTPLANESEIEPDTNTLHAHFTHDTRLHHHLDGELQNLARITASNENVENRPDRTETTPGPYDPSMGPDPTTGQGSNRHRLARSFRLPDADSDAQVPSTLAETAPLDLRIDGCYLERDANLGYWMSTESLGGFKFEIKFVSSFWMKPNFHPETTGKPRLMWNGGRAELRKNLWNFYSYPVEPGMLDLYLTASQNAETELIPFNGTFTNWYPTRPASLLFMHSGSYMTNPENFGGSLCYALCVATQTKSLNHHYHEGNYGWAASHPLVVTAPKESGYHRDNPLAAHRWMHVAVACATNWGSPTPDARIWVNGKSSVQMPESPRWGVYQLGLPSSYKIDWTFNFKDDNSFNAKPYADKNLMRFGQPHRVTSLRHKDGTPYETRHNYACDSTIDEFTHFTGWTPVTEGAALAQWRRGRYHVPLSGDEGQYTSKPFALLSRPLRALAPASGRPAPAGSGGGTTAPKSQPTQTAPSGTQPVRLLGATWTLFGETMNTDDARLAPQMIDYNSVDQPDPDRLTVKTELFLEADGIWHGPLVRDDFSAVLDEKTKSAPSLTDPKSMRFRVKFKWEDPPPSTTILLATPYIDDVTIYYETGDCGFLTYQME